jgi:hypothetical protein
LHVALFVQLGYQADVGAFTKDLTVTFVPEDFEDSNKRKAPLQGCIKHTAAPKETTYAIATSYGADPAKVVTHPDNAAVFDAAGSLAWPTPGAQLTVCA